MFRIEKGVLDINDPGVNDFFSPENLRVPFRNMVYIGDSDTDIPCMKLVNSYGGHSIGVFNPEKQNKEKVYQMLRDNRIKYFAPADYSEGSEIDTLIKNIIISTAAREKLIEAHITAAQEMRENDQKASTAITLSQANKYSQATGHSLNDIVKLYGEALSRISKSDALIEILKWFTQPSQPDDDIKEDDSSISDES